MSGTSNLDDLFECIQEGFMLEDLLSNILNVQDEPEALDGSQGEKKCIIDSKKNCK